MASLYVFCTPEELVAWIRRLCRVHGLAAIVFRDSAKSGLVIEAPEAIAAHANMYRMFLYPPAVRPTSPLTMNDIRARDWGWVDVRPGRLIEGRPNAILTRSEIHGEDFAHEPVHPAKYIRWLKRQLKGEITAGVTGKNTVTGGESTYRDISYSREAARLHQSGVRWKQFVDDNGLFEPAAGPQAGTRPR
jgi:hypothetical protein